MPTTPGLNLAPVQSSALDYSCGLLRRFWVRNREGLEGKVEVVWADVRLLEIGFVGEFNLRSLTVDRFEKTVSWVSGRHNGSYKRRNCCGYGQSCNDYPGDMPRPGG